MKRSVAVCVMFVAVLGCKRPPPPNGGAPHIDPIPNTPIAPPVELAVKLGKERARLERERDHVAVAQSRIAALKPRVERLTRAVAVSQGRSDVLRALQVAVDDGPQGIEIREIESRGQFWSGKGSAPERDNAASFLSILARTLSLPPLAPQPSAPQLSTPLLPLANGAKPGIAFEFTLAWPPQNGTRQTPALVVPGGSAPPAMPQPRRRVAQAAPSADIEREIEALTDDRRDSPVQAVSTELGAMELAWEKLRARYVGRRGASSRFDVAYVNGTLSQSSLVNLDVGEAVDTIYESFVARRVVAKGEGTFAEAYAAAQLFHADAVLIGEVRAEWVPGSEGSYLFTFGLYALRD